MSLDTHQQSAEGAEIREYRAQHGLSQKALCDILDIDSSTLFRWETGESRMPRAVLLWMRATNELQQLAINAKFAENSVRVRE